MEQTVRVNSEEGNRKFTAKEWREREKKNGEKAKEEGIDGLTGIDGKGRKGAIRRTHESWNFEGSFKNRFVVYSSGGSGVYWCAIGISFSPVPIAGSGASTVSTPSLLSEDLILSGLVPLGSRNSRLYSLYTDLLSVFSSCFAWTWTHENEN